MHHRLHPQHLKFPEESQASQKPHTKTSCPFQGIAIEEHCGKGSAHFQKQKALMRAESGPSTSTKEKQADWHQRWCLVAGSENTAWIRHAEIGNICSIPGPLGNASQLQATEERKQRGARRGQPPCSSAGTEMDPKDFKKGRKHPQWLLCSTTGPYMWLMGWGSNRSQWDWKPLSPFPRSHL